MAKQMELFPRARAKYDFASLEVGKVLRVPVPASSPHAGRRALTAAYAYGRRNGKKFFGQHVDDSGERIMLIGRSE